MSWDKIPTDLTHIRAISDKIDTTNERVLTYREAIREALFQSLKKDETVFLFGEGIDDNGGVFGTTTNLHKEFGSQRIFDTPLCESTLTGVAIGASLRGFRPILVHMRLDFLFVAMDQLANHAAKWKYMFDGKVTVPIVNRAIIGGGWGSAAQHSQAFQSIFAHIPGMKVVMPASAYDVKGLLLSSIYDDAPTIFVEHRWLYDHKDIVPEEMYFVPLGKSVLRREGDAVTVIANSIMVPLAIEASKELANAGIETEIIDLRTIKPLDTETIAGSVKKTGRAVVLDFGYKFCGISSEISSFLAEDMFKYLKAPVKRIALQDVPTPASHILEKAFYPNVNKIIQEIKNVL